jgi:hypothetical protein
MNRVIRQIFLIAALMLPCYAQAQTVNGVPNQLVGTNFPRRDCSQFTATSSTDGSIMLSDCLTALAALGSVGIADGSALPTATTWTTNPFFTATLPSNGGLIIMPPGTTLTNVPIVFKQHWGMQCAIGDIMGGIAGQYGCDLQAGASFPTGIASPGTGTVQMAAVGYHGTIAGTSTAFSSSMVGCRILVSGTQPTAAASTWGVLETVSSTTAATFSWSVNNTTGDTSAAQGYAMDCPVILLGNGDNGSSGAGAAQFYMSVKGMGISCNNVAGCIGVEDLFGQQGTGLDFVTIRDVNNIGLDKENACQNSGPWQNLVINTGTSSVAGTFDYVSRCGSGSPMIGLNSFTMGQSSGGTAPTWAMDLETPNEILGPGMNDLENGAGGGAIIAGNISCRYVCVLAPRSASGVVIDGLHTGAGMTPAVQISSDLASPGQTITVRNINSTSTNSIIDQVNSCSDTSTRVGNYVTNANGKIIQSTLLTAGCAASVYLATGHLLVSQTAPTISGTSGFNNSNSSATVSANNGTGAFNVTVGTGTGTSTGVLVMPAATTGWNCTANDLNRADLIQQTGSGTTSVTVTNYGLTIGTPVNWTNSDVVHFVCFAY